jgi:hypothetical protein
MNTYAVSIDGQAVLAFRGDGETDLDAGNDPGRVEFERESFSVNHWHSTDKAAAPASEDS